MGFRFFWYRLAARGRSAETAQNLVLSRLESMSIFNILGVLPRAARRWGLPVPEQQ